MYPGKVAVPVSVLFLFLTGCALSRITANLSMNIPLSNAGAQDFCRASFTVKNLLGGREIEPVVEILFFDASGNTLAQNTLYFDAIGPGKNQTKDDDIQTDCTKIRRAHVVRAYDKKQAGMDRGEYELVGVHGMRYTFVRRR